MLAEKLQDLSICMGPLLIFLGLYLFHAIRSHLHLKRPLCICTSCMGPGFGDFMMVVGCVLWALGSYWVLS